MSATSNISLRLGCLLLLSTFLVGCSSMFPGEKQRNIIANVNEGERQLTLGRTDEARTWFNRAVALAPGSATTYTGFADNGEGGLIYAMMQHNDWPDIANYLSAAVKNPKLSGDYNLWATLADAQDRLGQEEASKASYQRELDILNSPPTKGEALPSAQPGLTPILKATAEWGAGHQQQAVNDFHTLITRYPDQAPFTENTLAYLEAVANTRLTEALTMAQEAVSAARDSGNDEALGEFLDTLGWVEYRMHKYPDAARDLEEAIGDIPSEPISHYHLGAVYHAMGENDDALIELKRSAALDPSSPDTQIELRMVMLPSTPNTPKA